MTTRSEIAARLAGMPPGPSGDCILLKADGVRALLREIAELEAKVAGLREVIESAFAYIGRGQPGNATRALRAALTGTSEGDAG